MKEKHWLRLDLENDWQAVVPQNDIDPHSTVILNYPDGKKEGDLAGWECSCKPSVDFKDKLIIHNSFDNREKDEK